MTLSQPYVPLVVGRADLVHARIDRLDGTSESLTEQECALLAFFADRAGQDLGRDVLQGEVLGHDVKNVSRAVDSAVFRLRAKVEVDTTRPQQLITVQGSGYRWVAAQGRSGATNLPPERDGFVGRHALLERLEAGPGVHTLVGPPGVGKTALALAWARSRSVVYFGGRWWVPLAGARSAADVAQGVAAALGLPTTGSFDKLNAAIRSALDTPLEVLLILDNLEQVAELAAELVAVWAAACPRLHVLATSRRPLGCSGERVVQVAELPVAEAEALFVLRAQAVRQGWSPAAEERRVLRGLVQDLDGLPLAIELAASRVGALTIEAIRDRLVGRAGGPVRRAGPDRTLERAIAGSWDLLTDGERAVFAQCSVFAGPFSSVAADNILAVPEGVAVQSVLTALERQSMLTRAADGSGDWTVYRSLRAFAARQLANRPEQGEVIGRHAQWFVRGWGDRFGELYGPEGPALAARLKRDLPELLAVADRTADPVLRAEALVACLPPSLRLGHLGADERISTLMRDAGALAALPVRLQSELHRRIGLVLRRRADLQGAREHLERARDLAIEVDDPVLLADRLRDLGNLGTVAYDLPYAEALLRQSVALLRTAGVRSRLAVSLCDLAINVKRAGRVDEALALYEESLELHDETGNTLSLGMVLGNLGILHAEHGRVQQAESLMERSVQAHRDMGNSRSEGVALLNLGMLYDEMGDETRAEAFMRRALPIMVETHSRHQETLVRSNLGALSLRRGRPNQARRELGRALELALQTGHGRHQGIVHTELALVDWLAGDRNAAEVELDEARAALQGESSARDVAFVDLWTGAIHRDEAVALAALARCAAWAHGRDPAVEAATTLAQCLREVRAGDAAAGQRARQSSAVKVNGWSVRLLLRQIGALEAAGAQR